MENTGDRFVLRLTQKVYDKNKLKRPAQVETTPEKIQLLEWFVDLVEMGRPRLTLYVYIHPVIFLLVIVQAKNIALATEVFVKRLAAFLNRLGVKSDFYSGKLPPSLNPLLLPTNSGSILSRWASLKYILQLYINDYREEQTGKSITVDVDELCNVMEDRMATWPIFYTPQDMLEPGTEMVRYLTTAPEPVELAQAMQYEITLEDVEPPFSRVIQLSRQSTFYDLHHIIQVIMGLENLHLFEFRAAGKVIYLPEINEHGSDWEDLYDTRPLNSRNILLTDFISIPGSSFKYVYDFGDDWQLSLILKGYSEVPIDQLPLCLSGTGGIVPEDAGGAAGFSEMLRVLLEPRNEAYKDLKRWLGRKDPVNFNLRKTNQNLSNLNKYVKEYERYLPKPV